MQSQKKHRKRKRTGSSTNTSVISSGQSEASSMRELKKNKVIFIIFIKIKLILFYTSFKIYLFRGF